MSETVGRIDLILDVDGNGIPKKVRRVGNEAGDEYSKGFDDKADAGLTRFGDSIQKKLTKKAEESGRKAGDGWTDTVKKRVTSRQGELKNLLADVFTVDPKGLSGYVRKIGDVDTAFGNLSSAIDESQKNLTITSSKADAFRRSLDENRDAFIRQESAIRDADVAQKKFNADFDEATKLNRRFEKAVRSGSLAQQQFNKDFTEARQINVAFNKAQAASQKQLAATAKESKRLDTELERLRISTGNVFRDGGDGIEKYIRKFPSADEAIGKLNGTLGRLHIAGRISDDDFVRMSKSLSTFKSEGGKAESSIKRLSSGLDRGNKSLGGFNNNARQTPRLLKLIAGYGLLFTSLAPAIAVLSSATGSGLLALATNAGALALGLAVVVPGFKGMLGSLSDLPKAARPAAAALQSFKKPLGDLQNTIQSKLFDGLGDSLVHLRDTILPSLETGLGKSATTVNGIFSRLIAGLTSPSSVGRLNHIFDGLQPILANLGDTAINLGGVVGKLFDAALPSGQKLSGFLSKITGDFSNWLSDANGPGPAALTKFFDHLDEIMPSVGGLIASAGKAVSGLVTDKAVDNLTTFLNTMSTAIPNIVGPLGGLIDTLDPLGLASQALAGIGGFFKDNAPGLAAFGTAANTFVKEGGKLLGPIFKDVGDTLIKIAPDILKNLGDAIASLNTPENQNAIKKVLPKLGEVLVAASKAVDALFKSLSDSGTIAGTITNIGNVAKIATPLLNGLAGSIDLLGGNTKDAQKAFDGFDISGMFDGIKGFIDSNIITKLAVELASKLTDFFTGKDVQKSAKDGGGTIMGTFLVSLADSIRTLPGGNLVAEIIEKLLPANDPKPKESGKNVGDGVGKGIQAGLEGNKDAIAASAAAVADGTAAPFQFVDPKINSYLSSVPGSVASTLAPTSGQAAANQTSDPFRFVDPTVSGLLSSVPTSVNSALAPTSGQPAADKVSNPFAGVSAIVNAAVSNVPGVVTAQMRGVSGQAGADNVVSPFDGVPGRVKKSLSGLGSVVSEALSIATTALSVGISTLTNLSGHASGTITTGPEVALIGEAGREAVVPLDRPLSRVDPSVRALSAIAQGKFPMTDATTSTGRSITVAEGAITVLSQNADAENVANQMLDRLIARIQ